MWLRCVGIASLGFKSACSCSGSAPESTAMQDGLNGVGSSIIGQVLHKAKARYRLGAKM